MRRSIPTRSTATEPTRNAGPSATVRSYCSLLVLAAVLLAGPALAQQAETFGSYRVHYNALNTNLLTPDVAQAYGIQRAGTRAMLNITVLDTTTNEAVKATITAGATNLTGQRRDIQLREISDQGAIYYIGTFRIANQETLNFAIDVSPEGHSEAPYEFSFRQQFFVD